MLIVAGTNGLFTEGGTGAAAVNTYGLRRLRGKEPMEPTSSMAKGRNCRSDTSVGIIPLGRPLQRFSACRSGPVKGK